MRAPALLLLSVLAIPTAATAQAVPTARAGMSEAEVRRVFGEPATVRSTGGWTYLFYHNRCPQRCGSDDVVFLQDGQVVAAVIRTGARRFVGEPAAQALAGRSTPASPARPRAAPAGEERDGARVEGIRIRVPGTRDGGGGAEDENVRPSVVGPFPGRNGIDRRAPAADAGRRDQVPLAPPDTIDFSDPSRSGVPLPPPENIDFSTPRDTTGVAPIPSDPARR